jgi:hypothetical protein
MLEAFPDFPNEPPKKNDEHGAPGDEAQHILELGGGHGDLSRLVS